MGNNHCEVFFFGIIGAVTGGATAYPVPGSGTWAEGATELQIPIPRSGTLKNLYVFAGTAPGGAVTDTITIRDDGGDTAITCTLVAAAVENNDTSNTHAMTAADRVSVSYVAGAGSAAANLMIAVEIEFAQ